MRPSLSLTATNPDSGTGLSPICVISEVAHWWNDTIPGDAEPYLRSHHKEEQTVRRLALEDVEPGYSSTECVSALRSNSPLGGFLMAYFASTGTKGQVSAMQRSKPLHNALLRV
jgi:hypothetical protein